MIFDEAGSRRGQLFLSSILANPDERFPEPSDAPPSGSMMTALNSRSLNLIGNT